MSRLEDEERSAFARVKRLARERRAESDRKAAARRAAEMKEVARQLAARNNERKTAASDDGDSPRTPGKESA